MHSLSTCWRTCAVLSKEKRIFLKCTQAKQQLVVLPGPHVAECDPGGRNRGSVLEVPSSRASSPPTLRNGPVESIGLDRSQSPGKSGGCTVTRVTGHKALCPVTRAYGRMPSITRVASWKALRARQAVADSTKSSPSTLLLPCGRFDIVPPWD